jgi:hypothetical protein
MAVINTNPTRIGQVDDFQVGLVDFSIYYHIFNTEMKRSTVLSVTVILGYKKHAA